MNEVLPVAATKTASHVAGHERTRQMIKEKLIRAREKLKEGSYFTVDLILVDVLQDLEAADLARDKHDQPST